MEGTVNYEGSGDVFFAFYNGDVQLTEMPKKDSGLYYERAECNNSASVEWNNTKWAPTVTNLTKTKTKCTLYFSKNANGSNNVEDLMKSDYSKIAYDNTKDFNLRYIGNNPYNYIDIGDRDSNNKPILWRIIGIMNNMTVINEDGSESTGESLVKIIRADNIGYYSWDSSVTEINDGGGVNEWSQADIMTTLNFGAYWNKTSGQCYYGINEEQKTCDFSSTGLTASVKDKLVKVRWNTGTIQYDLSDSYTTRLDNRYNAKVFYEGERSNNDGKKLCSGSYCNDPVVRTTTWDGYIGLMYPSDFGYAVGGDIREECLHTTFSEWGEINDPYCVRYDWLYDSTKNSYNDKTNTQWTITPAPHSSYANTVFCVIAGIGIANASANYNSSEYFVVRPVAYLKSNIKIKANSENYYGSDTNPFIIE